MTVVCYNRCGRNGSNLWCYKCGTFTDLEREESQSFIGHVVCNECISAFPYRSSCPVFGCGVTSHRTRTYFSFVLMDGGIEEVVALRHLSERLAWEAQNLPPDDSQRWSEFLKLAKGFINVCDARPPPNIVSKFSNPLSSITFVVSLSDVPGEL
jgi:hypothetical protein